MQTHTHYTDRNGQHYLPDCLTNRKIEVWDYVCGKEWFDMGDEAASEIRAACRALEIETETDEDGLYVTELPAEKPKPREEWVRNGTQVGSGYDADARQFADGRVLLKLARPRGDYAALYDLGTEDEDFDLAQLVYEVASQGPGWFDGHAVERGDSGWTELAAAWDSWTD